MKRCRTGSRWSGLTSFSTCPADTNDDGKVDIDDIVNVVLDWGTDGSGNGGDANGDGVVNIDDIVAVVLTFGPCPGQ